jgi:hypothetical protein
MTSRRGREASMAFDERYRLPFNADTPEGRIMARAKTLTPTSPLVMSP